MREVLDLIKMAGPGIMIILDYVHYPRSTYVQQLLYYFHTFPSCFPIRVPHPWGFCCWLHCTGSQCYLVVYAHKSSLHMLQHDETYACAICIQVSMLIVYVSLSQNWGPPNPSLSFIFSRRGWESRTNSILSEKPMNCFIIQLSYCGSLTVDGRNPAPIEVGSLSGFFYGFLHPRWCRMSSINSMTLRHVDHKTAYVVPGLLAFLGVHLFYHLFIERSWLSQTHMVAVVAGLLWPYCFDSFLDANPRVNDQLT